MKTLKRKRRAKDRQRALRGLALGGLGLVLIGSATAQAASPQDLLRTYEEQAKAAGIWPGSFSAERGKELFHKKFGTGKPETPSCTSCHTDSPLKAGRTRAGKPIKPMALSRTPDRYSDPEKVEKWFRRNCRSVIGRECTPLEKGDFITFMISQ